MANTASVTMTRLQKVSFPFVLTDRDGNVDTTSTAVLSSSNPAIATIALDASDNRRAWITSVINGGGGCTCVVNRPGGATPLNVSVTITDIDLSGAQLGAGGMGTPEAK
jgi:hypothetical protein